MNFAREEDVVENVEQNNTHAISMGISPTTTLKQPVPKSTIMPQHSTVVGTTPRPPVAIFWDYENVALPSGCASPIEACRAIVAVAKQYGPVRHRRVYADYSRNDTGAAVIAGIAASGFHLVSTPRQGATKRKETLDRKLMADMIVLAWDQAAQSKDGEGCPLCVVLIASDGDYSYTLNTLRDRGVTNVVMYRTAVAQLLRDSADAVLDLEKDVLCGVKTKKGAVASDVNQGGTWTNASNASTGREKPYQLTKDDMRIDAKAICRLMAKNNESVDAACKSWSGVGPLRRSFVGTQRPGKDSPGRHPTVQPAVRFRLALAHALREGWLIRGTQGNPPKRNRSKKLLATSPGAGGPVSLLPLAADEFQKEVKVTNAMLVQMTPFGYAKIDPKFPVPLDRLEL